MDRLTRLLSLVLSRLRSVFSPKVEDSTRLRVLGLVALWLAAAGLLWAGAGVWLTLAGAVLGTAGHAVSWYRRKRRSKLWPLLIASSIIGCSVLMRSQMLEALSGNWLPLGQFLIMVQALSSFDLRTRGGLYSGLALSSIVLFFASQQAFNPVFGVFLMGMVVLLLAFLSVSFLEDGVRSAQVYWRRHQPSVMLFWIGTACGVFLLSGVAFWVMPRGQTMLGLPQVAILPLSGNSLDGTANVPPLDPSSILPALDQNGSDGTLSMDDMDGMNDAEDALIDLPATPPIGGAAGAVPGGGVNGTGGIASDAFLGSPGAVAAGEGRVDSTVVFYVRTKVASYWRGRILDTYDGRHWRTADAPTPLAPSRRNPLLWYNQDSFGLDNRLSYGQTFFVQQDRPDEVFTGYRGVRVIAEEGSLRERGVRQGDSYRVLSAHPRHTLEGLRESSAGWVGSSYVKLPPNSGRLRELSRQITAGAGTDFGKIENIVTYLARQGNYDTYRPADLVSYSSLDQFLFDQRPGSALDYATATVMLARAADIPARLALGYLPGIRDPLSGAYMVREQDAHAWAEVYFEGQGWVPIDTAPRPDITLLFDDNAGVGYLFQQGFGEKTYSAVKAAPSRLLDLITNLSFDPLVTGLGAVVFLVVFALRWWYTRSHGGITGRGGRVWLHYSPLPGEGRREVLKVYAQVEKLLGRQGLGPRQPWETVSEYAAAAGDNDNSEVARQLGWFTRAVWQAAYNPGDFPAALVAEARQRLALLKQALPGRQRAGV